MQDDIETVLTGAGIAFSREHRLSAEDRPDFFIPEIGTAIECKGRPKNKMEIWRQIERYTGHDEVKALILVTGKIMGLPSESNGKDLYYVAASAAWI